MYFTEQDLKKIQSWLKTHGVKDTDFANASLPLSGKEKVAIVQDGNNKIVPLYNLISATGKGLQFEVLSLADYNNIEDKELTTLYFCYEDNSESVSKIFLGSTPVNSTIDATNVIVANKSLYNILGVKDSSTTGTNAVPPYLLIYNPCSTTYQRTSSTDVEFGTNVIKVGDILKAEYSKGSSIKLGSNIKFKVTQGEKSEGIIIDTTSTSTIVQGLHYESKAALNNYNVGTSDIVTIELQTEEGESIINTAVGEKTVTRTTSLNVIASNLLTANNSPYIIEGPSTVVTTEDYPVQSLSCKLTFKPITYMYLQRSTTQPTKDTYSQAKGRKGYVTRKVTTTGSWIISNTTSTNQYYTLLIPNSVKLSNIYTTFLGNNSTVSFKLLGTIDFYGADESTSMKYKVYTTEQPVAFGDGTMTFVINT